MKKVWKWWWAWQDSEHEQWLAAQSRLGLHLRRVGALGVLHYFEQGAPAENVYRWDFKIRGGKSDYRQLFQDAGWELVGEVAGSWLCWRKRAGSGSEPEIFTDRASVKAKYRTLLLTILPGLAVVPLILLDRGLWRDMQGGGDSGLMATGVFALAALSLLLTTFGSLGLWRRLRAL